MINLDFELEKDTLNRALRTVSGVVERRQTYILPIYTHVLLMVKGNILSVLAADQDMQMISTAKIDKIKGEGAVAVPFRKLYDVCKAFSERQILLNVIDTGSLLVQAGRSKFTLKSLPANHFPSMNNTDQGVKLSIEAKQLTRLFESTAFAMANQDVRYFLNGLLLEITDSDIMVVATDGHRLAKNSISLNITSLNTTKMHQSFPRVILPRKGVHEILRILANVNDIMVNLDIASSIVKLSTSWINFSTRLLEGRFPDYQKVIPKLELYTGVAIICRQGLKDAFIRTSALFSEKTRAVRLIFRKNILKILAHNAEHDKAEEDIELDYQGPTLEIMFNLKYLIDGLNAFSSKLVSLYLISPNQSALLKGEDESGVYVIMPMRI